MTNRFPLRSHLAALMLLAPIGAALVAGPVQAQGQRATVADESIQSISVNADRGIGPGSTLRLEVRAAPNARRASVALGGSDIVVPLQQAAPGVYRGTYAVQAGDRIDPRQLLTARLRFQGEEAVSRSFAYPPAFQALAVAPVAVPAPAPRAATTPSFGPTAEAPRPSFGPAGGVQIERFTMRTEGRIEPGRELRFRLRGAPGADAFVDIPGVISGVDLAELRPGVYEGAYTIRARDNLAAFDQAVATLRNGSQRLTARVTMERDTPVAPARDDRPPQITDMSPAHGERVADRGRAQVSARVADEGSGIDANSIRMRIDGRDVSGDLRLANNEVRYRRELDPGRYTAELSVRDVAGNATTKSWTFDVLQPERERAAAPRVIQLPPGVLPLEITSHGNNAVVDNSNGTLAIQGRTVPNATVRVQVESVATSPGMANLAQQVLDQTVRADENGIFSVPVTPSGFVIPGNRYEVRLTATFGAQRAEERITLRRQG